MPHFAYLNNFFHRNNPDNIVELYCFSFPLTGEPSVEWKGHHVLGWTSYFTNGCVFNSCLLLPWKGFTDKVACKFTMSCILLSASKWKGVKSCQALPQNYCIFQLHANILRQKQHPIKFNVWLDIQRINPETSINPLQRCFCPEILDSVNSKKFAPLQ